MNQTNPTIHLLVQLDVQQVETLNRVRESIEAETLEEAATRLLADALHHEKHGDA